MEESMTENSIGDIIIEKAIIVHKQLGPGLLESTYEACLMHELIEFGLLVEQQKGLPVVYNQTRLNLGYRIDLFVEQKVIIEIKSVEALTDVHFAQLLTYLKLSDCRLGYLINFNVKLLKDGIRRVVNHLPLE
jgi:GxxExxY protein